MPRSTQASALALIDVAAGSCVLALGLIRRTARASARGTAVIARETGLAGIAFQGRAVAAAMAPRVTVELPDVVRQRGTTVRAGLSARAEALVEALVPVVLDLVLDQIDLTALVLTRVDIDAIAAGLDLDAAAARLDVEKVLDRMDLNEVVEQRVDLDRLAARLDVDQVLDRMDLNDVVERRVDLDRLAARLDIAAVAARLDLDPIIDRMDLIGLAEYVVDGIDLPRIIRESTGSVASEGLREVRSRSMEADQALAHLVDRMLLRRRASRNGRPRADENGSAPVPAPPAGGADAP
jgi:hypothetical protein